MSLIRSLALLSLSAVGLDACGAAPTPPTTVAAAPIVSPQATRPVVSASEPRPKTNEEAAAPVVSASAASAVGPVLPPPLPQGTRVLHIGDSMAGALGIELNRQLKEHGVKGTLRFETASFIPTWAWGETLPSALAELNPDLVLITLGMNELKIQDPAQRTKTIRKLVARIGDRPCVWISPPPLASGTNELTTIIRENCPPCAYMDTDEVYPDMPRLGDHVHPTYPARMEWAKRVIDWLAEHRDPNGARPWSFHPGTVGPTPSAAPQG
ncbi:MAG: hypothetical protein JW751_12985 [Polyangiaceae bacterium]|nr:hypothetical protein [Polyangiaceae bacterium]